MHSLSVTLAPWAVTRIIRDYGKPNARTGKVPNRVTKAMLRQSLRDFPDTEFGSARGYLTTREAGTAGIESLEVRQGPDLLAVVTIRDDQVVVS